MVEFFINRTRNGFELVHGEDLIDILQTAEAAADVAVRFAQDLDAPAYRIFYP